MSSYSHIAIIILIFFKSLSESCLSHVFGCCVSEIYFDNIVTIIAKSTKLSSIDRQIIGGNLSEISDLISLEYYHNITFCDLEPTYCDTTILII